jgi:hypothetical protein
MTRTTVIVSLWLLLSGGIGDRVLAAGRSLSPVRLLFFYFAVTTLTALALWLQLENDEAPRRNLPPGRHRRLYE